MDSASSVIWSCNKLANVPGASVTVTALTVSVKPSVWKVNAPAVVAALPGATIALAGSVPVPSVVINADSPTWKSLKAVTPVICVDVVVLVPTGGAVHAPETNLPTMKALVLAPASRSPATKLNVAL
jgi:hypothetical protein